MWKAYISDSFKNDRAAGIAVMAAGFLSALMLSLLCSLLYNVWNYEEERIKEDAGNVHIRIFDLTMQELEKIRNYANVADVTILEDAPDGQITAGIRLEKVADVYEDGPRIAALIGRTSGAVEYNTELLSIYLVRNPRDPDAYLILMLFLGIALLTSVSLILIIRHSFAVCMNSRIRQIGILSGIGATSGQIRSFLLREAAALCMIPVLAGYLSGIGASALVHKWADIYLEQYAEGRIRVAFEIHPLVLLGTFVCIVFTVWASALLPARKLARLTPMEAIRNMDGWGNNAHYAKRIARTLHNGQHASRAGRLSRKKERPSSLLFRLFGAEGELAGCAVRAQKKALRAAVLSLTLSLFVFVFQQCFFGLSRASNEITYWDRYQDVWDIYVTVKDGKIETFGETEAIREVEGVRDVIAYQKAEAERLIGREEISGELAAADTLSAAPETEVERTDEGWLVRAPVLIMDDAAFLDYCRKIGAPPSLEGAVILNRVRDESDPNYRERHYLPYLTGDKESTLLQRPGQEEYAVSVPVLAYTEEMPALREQYGVENYYELAHFIPATLWERIGGTIGEAGEELYIRVLAQDAAASDKEALEGLEKEIDALLEGRFTLESENRIGAKLASDRAYDGLTAIMNGFCMLLALFGLCNVFFNTLSFVNRRKREIARYLSVGMTPAGLWKMFAIEALIVAGRPVIVGSLLALLVTGWMMKIAYLGPSLLLEHFPVWQVGGFILAILALVGLSYWIGGRNVLHKNLAQMLRDDTMD